VVVFTLVVEVIWLLLASPDSIESSMLTSARLDDLPQLRLTDAVVPIRPDRIIDLMWLSELNVASKSQ